VKANRQPVTAYTNAQGERAWCAHRVVYVVTAKLFERVGLGPRLERERAAAAGRRAARGERIYAGALLRGREGLRAVARAMGGKRNHAHGGPLPGHASALPQTPDQVASDAQLVQRVMLGLRQKHPEWGRERLEAEALALCRRAGPPRS
jgi:hypothetical protein